MNKQSRNTVREGLDRPVRISPESVASLTISSHGSPSVAIGGGGRRGSGGTMSHLDGRTQYDKGKRQRSRAARMWRLVLVPALALPLAVATMTDVAQAAAVGTTNSSPPAGSYSGSESQNGNGISFYISASRKSVQDVSIPLTGLNCTPGNTGIGNHLSVASVAIGSTGSFSSTTTQHGVLSGYPATFTYTFKGGFHGVNTAGAEQANGTYSETIKYTDSVARTCATGSQTWKVARDSQPTQPTTAPPTGSYSGSESQNGNGISFYVSGSRTTLQDVSIPLTGLDCAPGNGGFGNHLSVASVALSSTGSFSSTTTQHGVLFGYPATFSYTFRGNFHGVNTSGAERAAGTYSETVTYTDSTARDCTTDSQTWTVARDSQPTQPTTAPPTGSYSGSESQNGNGITLYVSGSKKTLQDVSIPLTGLDCAPGNGGFGNHLSVASVALSSTGSFSSTTTQHGVLFGYPATFSYTFRGNFHGVNTSGAERAAGTYSETVTYTDSTARDCTTDSQTWKVARDSQPTQPTTAPPAGAYKGSESQNGNGMSFAVSTDQKSLQTVSIPLTGLDCAPGNGGFGDHLSVASIAIGSTGSFSSTTSASGTVSGHPATFTYTFRGNFHGVNASGAERAAGTYSETITYTDSTARDCTTDGQTWYASRTA